MAEPIHAAVRRLGLRVRAYAPVGDLIAGMAYLVRRLLENTSNESFIRHRFAEGQALDVLIAPPAVHASAEPQPEATERLLLGHPEALLLVQDDQAEVAGLPARLVLYAVEVTDVGHGRGLSLPVAAASRRLAERIRAEVPRCA